MKTELSKIAQDLEQGTIDETEAQDLLSSLGVVSNSCIVVNKKDASIAGSCNFCNREHNIVNVVTGTSFIEVRFCNKCFSELRNYR